MHLQEDLLKLLEQNGWAVTRQKQDRERWPWHHEIWVLESRWSPHGFTLFLSFLIDPQPGNPNPFWLIGTSFKLPVNGSDSHGEPNVMVTPNWIDDLPKFVAGLNAIRHTGAGQR